MGGVNWIISGSAPDGKHFESKIPQAQIAAAIGVGYLGPDGGRRIFNLPFAQPVRGPVTVRFTE